MQKKKVIIFGIGQIAEVAYDCLKNDSEYEVAAFTVDKEYKTQDLFFELPVVEFEDVDKIYSPDEYLMFVPISYAKLNKIREEKFLRAKDMGYEFASYISSKAINRAKKVGQNCFILELNNIQTGSEIGDNVILWSGNHIGHHSKVGDNCFISSHVVVSGSVDIGKNCFLGVNSTIRDNIAIGKESVIGAGSIILQELQEFSVVSVKSSEVSRVKSFQLKKI